MNSAPTGWRFFIDRGGTFTDVVAVSPAGQVAVHKLLSEAPGQYVDAALEAIRRAVPSHETVDSVRMGTTVATNALLERKGEPVVLVTTAGFEDALWLGDQTRPELFALEVRRPEPLYSCVIPARERCTHRGQVLVPLGDEDALRRDLQQAYDDGLRTVAVACLHSTVRPDHEVRIAQLAREIGFSTVVCSHDVSRLPKFVPRGQTAVADAYLTPGLRRYVNQVADGLGDAQLYFMQSHGGLAAAHAFHGRDAILSGPAGGVVGAAHAGTAAGRDRLIGFDMGGTSTDVCHIAGALETTVDTRVAGIRVRTPMLDIHTVAAGGGSRLALRHGRFVVGPESAGADPGPASYRRGGPLAVTDCNAVLGRLVPTRFPMVFGPNGDAPLAPDAARDAFETMLRSNGLELDNHGVERAAVGCLDVAVETMARAIRVISTERGHDLDDYTLVSFGGAGSQHACRVADALGIREVLVPPYSGVLSAVGIGVAEQRVVRQCGLNGALAASGAILETALSTLTAEVAAALTAQGGQVAAIDCTVGLRVDGSDTVLDIPAGDRLEARFDEAHRARFGFAPEATVQLARATATARSVAGTMPQSMVNSSDSRPAGTTRMWVDDAWQDVPYFDRDKLGIDTSIGGPALVLEATTTVVVEPRWMLSVHPSGGLLLNRTGPVHHGQADTGVDPRRLALFNHRFMSIAEHMGATLEQTSHSVNIKERRDYSCAVFDAEGRLVANAPHIPVHLGSMGDAVQRTLVRRPDLSAGDSVLVNDPYNGGTHLPDLTVVTPVVLEGERRFFVASRGHHADIGGIAPGSMPAHSTSIDEEGVAFDVFPLVVEGKLQRARLLDALTAPPYPARSPERNVADLQAQLAANQRGVQLLEALVSEMGLEVVTAYMAHVRHNAQAAVESLLETLPSGAARLPLDDGCHIDVVVEVDAPTRRARIDFSGSSATQPTNINAPRAVVTAAVLYVFRMLTGEDIPLNSGCLVPLDIVVPPRSMLDPQPPAAVVAGNVETSQVLCDALLLAVGALAGGQGTMNNLTFGNDHVQYYETIAGGSGAGPTFSGESGVQVHMTNSRLTDPEVLEARLPVRVQEFSVRRGSGGSGQHRGGDGVMRALEFTEDVHISLLANRRTIGAPGLGSGGSGMPGTGSLTTPDGATRPIGHRAQIDAAAGSVLRIETPGGGGAG